MDKDPKQNLKQNNKLSPDDNGKKQKNVNISSDDWNKMQSNMKHMSNTINNLSTKLENAQKKANTHVAKSNDIKPSPTDDKYVSKDEFKKLVDQNKQLNDRMQKQNTHANVLKHAKDTLKQNGMKVSSATFNHLLGPDNRTTDANIGWFKKIYKQAKSRTPQFPQQSHHTDKKTTIGAQLAKDDKNNGTMRPIDDCFKD